MGNMGMTAWCCMMVFLQVDRRAACNAIAAALVALLQPFQPPGCSGGAEPMQVGLSRWQQCASNAYLSTCAWRAFGCMTNSLHVVCPWAAARATMAMGIVAPLQVEDQAAGDAIAAALMALQLPLPAQPQGGDYDAKAAEVGP